ncbi:MAG: PAS domain S-box protein [Bacteroidetes bacterium]|nr:PAS domain S-box protein [Bacteroidota bacterium]
MFICQNLLVLSDLVLNNAVESHQNKSGKYFENAEFINSFEIDKETISAFTFSHAIVFSNNHSLSEIYQILAPFQLSKSKIKLLSEGDLETLFLDNKKALIPFLDDLVLRYFGTAMPDSTAKFGTDWKIAFEKELIKQFNVLNHTSLSDIPLFIENNLVRLCDECGFESACILEVTTNGKQVRQLASSHNEPFNKATIKTHPTSLKQLFFDAISNGFIEFNNRNLEQFDLLKELSKRVKSQLSNSILFPLYTRQKELGFLFCNKLDEIWYADLLEALSLNSLLFTNSLERLINERQRIASEVKFNTLAESAHVAIFISDNYRIVFANESATTITGYSYDELMSKSIIEILDEKEQESALKSGDRLKAGQKKFARNERKIITKSGEKRYIDITSNIIEFNGRKSLLSVALDVTEKHKTDIERLELIERLTVQNQDLAQFSYITSHNLRSPVAGILGLVNLLKLQNIEDEFVNEVVDKIKQASHKLDNTIRELNEIISVRQVGSKKRSNVDLIELVEGILAQYSEYIRRNGILIKYDFSKCNAVYVVSPYLKSIIENLISNSLKYLRPNVVPTISISSMQSENGVTITVTDNGIGIDIEKYKSRLFKFKQRFHRDYEGTGIGLYLVKTQAEALGGTIMVNSTVNKGSTFTLKLGADSIVSKVVKLT